VTATQTHLSIGELSLRLGVLESRIRSVFRTPRPYVVTVGKARGVAEQDLHLLADDLRAAGYLPTERTV
jgi:hypothetical protein